MIYEVYLVHHGIKGQKWGVRRYQNADGSYTQAGLKRHAKQIERDTKDFLRKDAGLSRRDARRGAKIVAEARTNKDKDLSKELTDLVRKVTRKEYDAANKYVTNRTDGKKILDAESAEKVFKDSKKMTKIYDNFGKSTLSALHLDDKYDFLADLDESFSGLFINSEVHDKKSYADLVRAAEQEDALEKQRRARAGLR